MFVVLICFFMPNSRREATWANGYFYSPLKKFEFLEKVTRFSYFKIIYVLLDHMKTYQLAYSGIES